MIRFYKSLSKYGREGFLTGIGLGIFMGAFIAPVPGAFVAGMAMNEGWQYWHSMTAGFITGGVFFLGTTLWFAWATAKDWERVFRGYK